jgi:PAS domain S-box-containing protein
MNDPTTTFAELSEKVARLESENKLLREELEVLDCDSKLVIWGTNAAIWDWDYKTGVVKFSAKKAEMLGYKPIELNPDVFAFTSMIHPDDHQFAMDNMSDLLSGKSQVYEVEYRIKAKNGTWKWFSDKGKIVERDENNGPSRIVGIVNDITCRKNAEQLIIKLQKAVESSQVSIVITDFEGNIEYANPFFSESSGYSPKEYMGKNLNLFKSDFHETDYYRNLWDTIKSGQTWKGEFCNRMKNGQLRWEQSVISPVKNEKGQITHFVAVKNDISERKKTELALKESETKLNLALEVAQMGYWRYEIATSKVEWSSGHEVLYGIPLAEFKGSLDSVQSFVHPDDRSRGETNLLRTVREKVPFNNTYRVIYPGGTIHWLHSYGHLMDNDPDDPEFIFGITQDITARKQIEEELIAAKEKAEESNKLKTAFLNNISHEIRTPLNAITGFSQLLTKTDLTLEKRLEFCEVLSSSSHKLIEIITDVIEVSQLQSRQMKVRKSHFNFVELINRLNKEFKEQISHKGLLFKATIEPESDCFLVFSDENKIYRIIKHLLDNAVKYTQQGSIIADFLITREKIDFKIADTGIGISKEMQEVIFEPFRQVDIKASSNYGGNGVGLSIVRGFVQLLHGTLTMQSEIEIGTTVTVTVPNHAASNPVIKSDPLKETPISLNSVLIVEDEYSNYSYLAELMQSFCRRILYATHGQQAIDICRAEKDLDLVFMDIKMPVMDGHTATKLIKAFRPGLPVIAQTAYALENNQEDFLRSGFDDYIYKPIQIERLLELIKLHVH